MYNSCLAQGIVDYDRSRQGIKDIYNAGFNTVVLDFSLVCSPIDFESYKKNKKIKPSFQLILDKPDLIRMAMDNYIKVVKAANINMNIAIAPYLPCSMRCNDLSEKIKQMTIACIKCAIEQFCKYIIVVPIVSENHLWKDNIEFYMELLECIKDSSLTILLENQCKNVNGHYVRGFCSDEFEASQFVDELNYLAEEKYGQRIVNGEEIPYFGFCMNTGTCNLCGQNMYDFAVTLDSRIKAVILRDCNGNQDTSMLPFTCVNDNTSQTDWLNLIRGLRKIRFDGELIMDFSDTAAAFSPILKPQLLVLAKSIADYFKWQIEIESLLDKYPSRVLFGAGNMCRNYMKNYGEKYPPLFTCDNNRNIWGQTFEGLEIKNPECLKDVSSDTAIFICNVYYREIEEQLRGMGLKNPIEYFNDEYMPSFHFNRIDTVTRKLDKEED